MHSTGRSQVTRSALKQLTISKANQTNPTWLFSSNRAPRGIVDTYAKLRALKEEERQKWMLPRFKTASNLGKRHTGDQNWPPENKPSQKTSISALVQ